MKVKIEKRFWSKVDLNGPVPAHRPELGPCWVWTAGRMAGGYGRFYLGGRERASHRLAWSFRHGPIPPGDHHGTMCVLHRCDRPECVRIDHLFLGSQRENIADMNAKGRGRPPRPGPGHRNSMATLSEVEVGEIRRRFAAGGVTQADLAHEYGVLQPAVSRIVNYLRWVE